MSINIKALLMKFPDLSGISRWKKLSAVFLFLIFLFLLINKGTRGNISSYFSTRCLDYHQKDFSRKLSDKLILYSYAAKLKGIKACNDDKDIKNRIANGKLVKVKSTDRYEIEKMTHSVPCVTKDSKVLLDEIARRFRDKTSQKGIMKARFIVTSMTRKTENLKSLRKNNINASINSPHLYGNAFDISYKRFVARKWMLTNCDKKFLKEALAEVICQLRAEKKCWATYEKSQNCFHVVCR
jgi:hypothetical protein